MNTVKNLEYFFRCPLLLTTFQVTKVK